jgi:hypothetical protein
MIDWIKTAQAVAAIVAVIFATMGVWWNLGLPRLVFLPELAPIHARIEALEQFNRDTRLLMLDQTLAESANPLGMLWLEMDAALVTSGGGGDPPAVARRPVVIIAAG